jgi:hypothetical protein
MKSFRQLIALCAAMSLSHPLYPKDSTGDCPNGKVLLSQSEIERLQSEAVVKYLAEQDQKAKLAKLEEEQKLELNISDCDNLKVTRPEDQEILEELIKFCKQDPDSFFAQLDTKGQLKFMLKLSEKDSRVFTFTTEGDVTFEYKEQKLTLKGKYEIDTSGDRDNGDFSRTQKVTASAEYAMAIAKSNIDAFVKLSHNSDMVTKPDGSNNVHTTTGTVGVKYNIFDLDYTKLVLGTGFGGTAKFFGGSLATEENKVVPVWSADLVFEQVVIEDRLKAQAGASILQDLTRDAYTQVKWNAGFDTRVIGGLGVGGTYQGDYDQTREAAGNKAFNHTVLGTLSFTLDPDAWKSNKRKEREKRARERIEAQRERDRARREGQSGS